MHILLILILLILIKRLKEIRQNRNHDVIGYQRIYEQNIFSVYNK